MADHAIGCAVTALSNCITSREESVMNTDTQLLKQESVELIGRAYDHHKTHGRHIEQQRFLVIAAYLAISATLWFGDSRTMTSDYDTAVALFQLLLSLFLLVPLAKYSAEYRRHTAASEEILKEVNAQICEIPDLAPIKKVFRHTMLETAAHATRNRTGKALAPLLSISAAVVFLSASATFFAWNVLLRNKAWAFFSIFAWSFILYTLHDILHHFFVSNKAPKLWILRFIHTLTQTDSANAGERANDKDTGKTL